MEVSLVPILVLDPDMSGQIHHWLQTNRANLLDALVDGLNVRLEGLTGGELSPTVSTPMAHLFLVVALSVSLLVLSALKIFFTSLALEP